MKLMVVALLILGLSYVQSETKLSDELSDKKQGSESLIQPLDCTVLGGVIKSTSLALTFFVHLMK